MCSEQNWQPLQSSKLQVKAEYTESCPLAYCCPAILSFQTGMDATLHASLFVSWRVWAATIPPVVFQCRLQKLEFLQWHPSVGRIQLSFSSGIPVWAVSTKFFQWCSSVPCKYSLGCPVVSLCTLGQPVAFQWHSSVHWTKHCTLAQGKETCATHSNIYIGTRIIVPIVTTRFTREIRSTLLR